MLRSVVAFQIKIANISFVLCRSFTPLKLSKKSSERKRRGGGRKKRGKRSGKVLASPALAPSYNAAFLLLRSGVKENRSWEREHGPQGAANLVDRGLGGQRAKRRRLSLKQKPGAAMLTGEKSSVWQKKGGLRRLVRVQRDLNHQLSFRIGEFHGGKCISEHMGVI